MKKYTYFESSAHLSQLEARLDKNSYLSRGSLPNSSDAKVFLLFQRLRKIPKRTIHPNLYHWYILMKQFSTRTVQIWQHQVVGNEQDRFINEYVMQQTNSAEKENNLAANNQAKETTSANNNNKTISSISTPKSSNKSFKIEDFNENSANRHNLVSTSLKNIPCEVPAAGNLVKSDIGSSPAFEIQYVMEMQLKDRSRRVHGIRQRLQQQKLQLISLQQQQDSIRVVFRAEAQQYERLKDRISKWDQISNLRFRKQKRFNIKSENKSQKIISSSDMGIATTN